MAALLPRTVDLFAQEGDPNFRLFSKESRALHEKREALRIYIQSWIIPSILVKKGIVESILHK